MLGRAAGLSIHEFGAARHRLHATAALPAKVDRGAGVAAATLA
jgi:hypothetical protein